MTEVKSRKKAAPKAAAVEPAMRSEEGKRPEARGGGGRGWADPRTGLSLLSLGTCLGLAWFVFQQSEKFARVENQYQLLRLEANDFQGLQRKISLISEKCQKFEALMEQLKSFQVTVHLKHLKEEIFEVKSWSNRITEKQGQLNNNVTALSQEITKIEQTTTSVAKDVALKITSIKTDIRRMSGLVTEVTSLTDSVQGLEGKIEKAEKNTVKNIGDLLSSSIDRTAALRRTASENSQRIHSVKKTLSELSDDFNKHMERFLSLESDRAKVLKTVNFANDLKPKVYNLKKDFSRLEPLVNDLTLRVGRLVTDLQQREKEIAFLNEKISNLTIVRAEIKDMKDEITHLSDMD
ncbi:PREDICTED: inhibitor of nuclear factor kappa-B kinase-interacting protein isoform X2 [Elephantulus edwardii]|uniref:inhibitor of nuclear factor kappa-B kinase-interacting protein isoform X2 n=1 Tax=Elephantulus edwardii TaxID=28737 RepID=UPI0003F09F53|nr:PREDICTED: inhibitor of nuclear factor kappa-B kinase-interacting protein isoform X2 [Elephantulus edwardii]